MVVVGVVLGRMAWFGFVVLGWVGRFPLFWVGSGGLDCCAGSFRLEVGLF